MVQSYDLHQYIPPKVTSALGKPRLSDSLNPSLWNVCMYCIYAGEGPNRLSRSSNMNASPGYTSIPVAYHRVYLAPQQQANNP